MKKYFLMLIAFVVFCGNIQSQAPQRFNYQVIARDADGNPLINQSVNFQISILQGSAAGTAVYIETHAITTNDFGLATMAIGAGSVVTGVFSSISWGTDSYYVRTELDPTGGTSFTFAGVTQLLSVPYALYANSSGSGGSTYTAGLGIDITGSTITNTEPNAIHWGDAIGGNELSVVRIQGRDVLATPPTNGQVLTWNGGYNAWEPSNAGSMVPGTSGQTLRNDGTDWVASNQLYNDGTNIGIGTTTPAALLHVEGTGAGTGNVLFCGDYENTGFGSAPIEGAGTRMMWYPDKAAFRAGTVFGTQWNTANIGDFSVAFGSNNIASGVNSVAFGHNNDATGSYSTTMGTLTNASGYMSLATGYRSWATGQYATAIGYQAHSEGEASVAIGFNNYASGNYAVALGEETEAPSRSETVVGSYSTIYFPTSGGNIYFNPIDRIFSIGNGTSSSLRSNAMTVLKNGNTGLGIDFPLAQLHTSGSIRFAGAGTPGAGKVLTSDDLGNATWQTISGGGSLPSGTSGQTLRHDGSTWSANSLLYNDNSNIGVGTTTPSALLHVNGMGMGNGNVVFTGDAEDYLFGPAPVTGAGTRMMWYPDKAAFRAGKVSGTEWDTDNIGIGSIAMGFATQATNYNTTALGSLSIASGGGATAIGEVSIASGLHSFALGYASNATETYSYAFGNQVTASGPQSLALGNHSTASGTNSVAIGTDAYATGYLSKSIGFDCHASGNHSVALGDNITAPSMSETVIGTYNTSYIPIEGPSYFHPLDRLFVIGNGTSTSARSNALTMLKNGNTGLGTDFPEAQLHTTGSVRFEGAGTPGIGKVLTSDEVGNATWQTISGGGGGLPSGVSGQTLRHDGSTWVANSLLFNNNTNIGIGTTTPTALLHTNGSGTGEGNVLFTGEVKYWEPGAPPASGMGTRLMWFPDKAAFRVGGVSSNEWDNENTGHYSVAMGYGTIAKDYASTAMGLLSSSTGFVSTALGYMTDASETACLATGYNTHATGSNSTAMGNNTIAPSFCETVIGRFNTTYTLEPGGAANWKINDRLFVIGNGINIENPGNALTVMKNGNIGIGADQPTAQLHTTGTVRFEGTGTPGEGKVLTSDATGNATWKGYSIGDFAQGGIIFWLDETGQHGLVVAKSDQATGVRWYAGTYGSTQAKGAGPFSGEMNTAIIIAAHVAIGDDGETYAARICNELQITEGGKTYGDWYLPSMSELGELYFNWDLISAVSIAHGGSALANIYWSSTEKTLNSAWIFDYPTCSYSPGSKHFIFPVRAIRAF